MGYWSNYSGLSVATLETLYTKQPNRSSSSQHLYSMVWPGGTTYKPRGWGFSKQWKAIKNRSSKLSYQDFVSRSRLNGVDIPSILHICVPCFHKVAYLCSYRIILFGDGYKNSSFSELINKITTNVSKI